MPVDEYLATHAQQLLVLRAACAPASSPPVNHQHRSVKHQPKSDTADVGRAGLDPRQTDYPLFGSAGSSPAAACCYGIRRYLRDWPPITSHSLRPNRKKSTQEATKRFIEVSWLCDEIRCTMLCG
jgi:hypothetical protein